MKPRSQQRCRHIELIMMQLALEECKRIHGIFVCQRGYVCTVGAFTHTAIYTHTDPPTPLHKYQASRIAHELERRSPLKNTKAVHNVFISRDILLYLYIYICRERERLYKKLANIILCLSDCCICIYTIAYALPLLIQLAYI